MNDQPITDALQASGDPMRAGGQWLPWRTGRKLGRTIYAQLGALPGDDDPLIGVMDTPALADEAALAHNAQLRSVQESSAGDSQ